MRALDHWPDDELDAYILGRLSAVGVDLSVLPEDDPEAPADRRRLMRSARRFLRETSRSLADFDPGDGTVPALFPAARHGRGGSRADG